MVVFRGGLAQIANKIEDKYKIKTKEIYTELKKKKCHSVKFVIQFHVTQKTKT